LFVPHHDVNKPHNMQVSVRKRHLYKNELGRGANKRTTLIMRMMAYLFFVTCFIFGSKTVFVLRSDWQNIHACVRKVIQKKNVFAKGSIPFFKIGFIIPLIHNFCKGLHRIREYGSPICMTRFVFGKLSIAKRINQQGSFRIRSRRR